MDAQLVKKYLSSEQPLLPAAVSKSGVAHFPSSLGGETETKTPTQLPETTLSLLPPTAEGEGHIHQRDVGDTHCYLLHHRGMSALVPHCQSILLVVQPTTTSSE